MHFCSVRCVTMHQQQADRCCHPKQEEEAAALAEDVPPSAHVPGEVRASDAQAPDFGSGALKRPATELLKSPPM